MEKWREMTRKQRLQAPWFLFAKIVNCKRKNQMKKVKTKLSADFVRERSTRVIRITQVILKYQEVLPEWYAQSYLLSGFPNTESVMACNLIAGIARFQTFSRTIDYFCNRRNNAINHDSARIISLLSSIILFADVFLLNRCRFEIVNRSLREIFRRVPFIHPSFTVRE